MSVLGILHRQGRPFTLPAAAGAAGIFTITFVWRSIVQWSQVHSGESDHTGIAALLTLMTLISAIMLTFLVRQLRR